MNPKNRIQIQEVQFANEEKDTAASEKRKEEAKQVLYITRI